MIIDGSTANRAGKTYCMFDVSVEAQEGRTTRLDYTIWLPLEDTRHATRLDVPTSKAIVATTPRIPGLEVHIPAGVTLRTEHGHPLTSLSLTPVPVDRPPFPLPEGTQLFFTPQAHGARVESVTGDQEAGIRIIFPNIARLAAGSRVELLTYDSIGEGWHAYGQGTVTADGRQIVPDPDVVIKQFMCLHIVGPESDAPPEGPPPSDCSAYDGDPVHLGTGLFVMNQTDLVLPDTIPIAVTRTYRQRDTKSRPFGIGSTHPYQMILVGPGSPYSQIDLLLADGGRVRFNRISAGTSHTDAVLEHTTTPSAFYKATLSWNAVKVGWDLKFKDGSMWRFKVFGYNQGPPSLEAIRDRNGNEVTISYATARKIEKVTSPNGRGIEFTYDASNRITQAKDNTGRVVSYQYDASGRLWKVTDAMGGVTEYSYDTSHRMLTIKDAKGIVYLTNEYDANGKVIKQTMADGGIYQYAYTLDGSGKVTQAVVTDPRGQTRTMTFNASGYSQTDTESCCGGGLSQTYERESGTNRVLAVTDSAGRSTEYTHDSMGNTTSVTVLVGTSEEATTTFTYEPIFNKVASMTDPLNHTATFGYDSKGNLISVTDALNHQATFTYNTAGQMLTSTNALGNTTQYVYEGGDLAKVINPLGQSVTRFVDAAGRLLSVTNALGQTTRYEYNALNRATKVIDPIQGMTQFAYDANANLLSVTDARGKVTSYTFNNMDRVAMQTDPLGRQESYQYDLNGNLTQATDRKAQVTTFTYDALDRLSLVTYHDTSTISYTYDSVSRLSQVTDSISGTITYSYDNFDRLLSETTGLGAVSYGYDAASRLTSRTVAGQTAVGYSYDNADRLTAITQGSAVVSFAYDNANRRATMTLPNGVVEEYGYDAASRLTGITYRKDSATLGNLSYEYDSSGRRVKMGGSFARMNLPSAISTTTYDDANRQTGFGSQSLTYDNNGNLTSDGVNTYTWDARDHLASISGPGLSASFQYDAYGRRISKTINSASVSFLYDGANIVQEKVGSSVSANMLNGGIDEVFTRSDSSGTSSFVKDALGSTVALTNSAGAIQTEHTYEPFGKTTTIGTSSNNTSKYTGREDDGTGLYFYRARYYSPTLQRFISQDPIGFRGGDFNLYAYVSNDPVMKTDPTGKEQFTYRQDGSIVFPTYGTGGRKNSSMDEVWAMAGCIALADGPEPGPADVVAVGFLILAVAAAIAASQHMCKPKDGGGKVIPFPRPKVDPMPPPPSPPGNCKYVFSHPKRCRYLCPDGETYDFEPWELGVEEGNCPKYIPFWG